VRAFLGLASFYRRLVPKFAEVAKPLTELLKKDAPFKWETKQQLAFDNLRQIQCSDEVLAHPDFNTQFILTMDASKTAIGAILSQIQDGIVKPISFASRQRSRTEQHYSGSELEMLAVTLATAHYRCYLYGKRFIVSRDHAALRYLHNVSRNNARLMRWRLRLAEYNFVVQHRVGSQIRHVDAMSRYVLSVCTEQTLTKDKVHLEQKRDKFCNSLKNEEANRGTEYFYDQEGVIYKRSNGEHRLLVPQSLVKDGIALNHSFIYAANPGHKMDIGYHWAKILVA
jgi:hypothetical protein